MPKFRALRKKVTLLELCRTPELVLEVTKWPIEDLDVDAAILFSDILIVLDALGIGLEFCEGKGPVITSPIQSVQDIDALSYVDPDESLSFVREGVKLLKSELSVPLIGFAGGPFTIASYLIEGGTSKDFAKTKRLMLTEPEAFQRLLTIITDLTIAYLQMQAGAGADCLQVFESWAHALSWDDFNKVVLPHLSRIVKALPDTPVLLFCRGSSVFYPLLTTAQPAGIGLDWNVCLRNVRQNVPLPMVLQGNLDPMVLYGTKDSIQLSVESLLEQMRGDPAFIFNLGHGLRPDFEEEKVRFLVDCVKAGVPSWT